MAARKYYSNPTRGNNYARELTEPLLPLLTADEVDNIAQPVAPMFIINEAMFPTRIFKKQSRIKHADSAQKVPYEEIKIDLIFKQPGALQFIKDIKIKLHHKSFKSTNITGPIAKRMLNVKTCRVQFDMDNVEDFSIFKLEKSPKEEKKKFYFEITVQYLNGTETTQHTKEFIILGKDPNDNKKREKKKHIHPETQQTDAAKRSKLSPFVESNDAENAESSTITGQSRSGSSTITLQEQMMEVSELVAQTISTKTLKVDGKIFGQQFETPRHDLGYCFYKRDGDEKFEEGEVVGILWKKDDDVVDKMPDDDSKRQVVISKLTRETAEETILKGVITLDPYIVAYCPATPENELTVILCMLGIVPVKVLGSVKPREALYASVDHPGVAVSAYHLQKSERKYRSFVGIAFSPRDTTDECSVGMVEAAVSILQSASQTIFDQKLNELEEDLSVQIHDVKRSHKSWRKFSTIAAIIFVILLVLTGIFLWQLYQPGSAFRKALCKKGHLKPLSKAWYTYIPWENHHKILEAHGIEFDFDVLIKKTSHKDYPSLPEYYNNETHIGKARYYRNINRCAYGSNKQYMTKGPDMFAVDEKCYYVFEWDEVMNGWKKYNSANWLKYKNVHCDPQSPYKNTSFATIESVH